MLRSRAHRLRWPLFGLWLASGCALSGNSAGNAAGHAGNAGTSATGGSGGTNAGGAGGGMTATGGSDCGASPDISCLPYYRLRIEYIDNSDWTSLGFDDSSNVIKTRVVSIAGQAMASNASKDGLGLNAFQADSGLTMTADVALDLAAADTPFSITLGKGAAGTVTIRVSTVVGTTVTLVKEILNQAGQLTFTVDLSSLKGTDPELAPITTVGTMGLALYYPWYSLDNWVNSATLRDTPLTPYASNDPTALARQIDQAQSAGINGFSVSWIGPGSDSDNNTRLLLTEAAQKGFRIGFFLETTGGNLAQDPSKAVDWLSYIAAQYSDDPAVLAVDGKPVVTPWLTNTIPVATWATIRAGVRARGKDVWLVQDCQDMDYLDVFDGVRYSGGITGLGEKVRYYSVLADHPAAKLWISTAMPGFDERLLSDRGPNPRYIDRQDGAYFRGQLDAVFANFPQWVIVDTWNEWYENTYIEPSVNYGRQYLDIAGGYLNGWVTR
jgi:hypothetical protein